MNINPAFPVTCGKDVYSGMMLRDYFAAQALAGMMADGPPELTHGRGVEAVVKLYARGAYALADAMLEARRDPDKVSHLLAALAEADDRADSGDTGKGLNNLRRAVREYLGRA